MTTTISAAERVAEIVEGDSDALEADKKPRWRGKRASPRPWGFDVEEINRSYTLAIWGGKAVVVNEQPCGPMNDRVRVMTFESMNSRFANRYTEVVGSDGKVRPVS